MTDSARTVPPLLEDVMSCFCGHGLFDHDEYGPCSKCKPKLCEAWHGCVVLGGRYPSPSGESEGR